MPTDDATLIDELCSMPWADIKAVLCSAAGIHNANLRRIRRLAVRALWRTHFGPQLPPPTGALLEETIRAELPSAVLRDMRAYRHAVFREDIERLKVAAFAAELTRMGMRGDAERLQRRLVARSTRVHPA